MTSPGDLAASSATSVRQAVPGRTELISGAVWVAFAAAAVLAGNFVGLAGLAIATGVVQVAAVIAWMLGGAVPGRIGGILLGVAAAGGADAALYRWHETGFRPVLPVLGLALALMFVHQLSRGVVRVRAVESLADITVLLVAVVSLSGLILLRHKGGGDLLVSAAAASTAAGLFASYLLDAAWPRARFDASVDRGLPAVALGIGAGAAVGWLRLHGDGSFGGAGAAAFGALTAVVACLLSVAFTFACTQTSGQPPAASRSSSLRPLASALMALSLTVPVSYVLISTFVQ